MVLTDVLLPMVFADPKTWGPAAWLFCKFVVRALLKV
jgi:hypothetical protein